ncbi:uncharacterized protein LOC129779952 isoform X2 [Toxorhynchites rutilus septentrionalis]|uniref:uncharacterized protein LOC129779952 isoform X2 n=1 Tax=Toxorhynchites rutilus septentrionalis TaxID=329112 RepID=UPI00247AF9EF|nr:uncharacterized protein LOC129779952 isoform X2 [Toxorhynchites rutilus septentrionalis]
MPKTSETRFVNSLFLTNLIQSHYGETDVKIRAYDVEPATIGTTNHCVRSSMNRILVKYVSRENPSEKIVTFVAKMKLSDGRHVDEVFQKELSVYESVLPNAATIQKPRNTVELAPCLIASSSEPFNFMILEDITMRGYCVENQELGLNIQQSKMAIEKLAFFHAASAVLISEDPNRFVKFSKGTFHTDHKDELAYFTKALTTIVNNGSELGIGTDLLDKLKTLPSRATQKAIEAYSSEFQGLAVLNHGDFWTNNIMFKYNNSDLVDVLFIDFQNCVVGSPIVDLIYFLTSSPSYDVLEQYKDELIYVYHETLSIFLHHFGYQKAIPSLMNLQVELLKYGSLEVILSLTTAPYLRTRDAQNIPPMVPALHIETQGSELLSVLKAHSNHIIRQLQDYELRGLLEWGTSESKIKGLVERFQC